MTLYYLLWRLRYRLRRWHRLMLDDAWERDVGHSDGYRLATFVPAIAIGVLALALAWRPLTDAWDEWLIDEAIQDVMRVIE